jgi:hypothetical protein
MGAGTATILLPASCGDASSRNVVNHRHLRKRPMIFTTNKPLSEWGKVLHDGDLAAAILERGLIHRDGTSGRTRQLDLEELLPAAAERARISATHLDEVRQPNQLVRQ